MRQFVIVGLGRFGKKVAITLSHAGMPVVAIDKDPRKVEAISDKVAYAIRADATDQKALSTLGLSDADVAIISMGNLLEASVLATIILKEFGIPKIIVKGISPEHGRILKLVGATTVVFPEAMFTAFTKLRYTITGLDTKPPPSGPIPFTFPPTPVF